MIRRYHLPTRLIDDEMGHRRGPKYLPSRGRDALVGLEDVTWRWLIVTADDGTLEADVTDEQAAILAAQPDVEEVQ